MRAPWSTAQTMPAATSTSLPVPSASSTFTGRIEASGATPDSASPLPSTSAIVPATCVPWPLSSAEASLPAMTFQPGSRRPARSGAGATPVSTTATTTPAPRVTSPGGSGPDRVEAPLPGAAGIGLGRLERAQAPLRLGVADGARPAQHAQRDRPAVGRQAHDDGAQLRHRSHLHRAGCLERARDDGARPQADDDRVRAVRGAREQQRERAARGRRRV